MSSNQVEFDSRDLSRDLSSRDISSQEISSRDISTNDDGGSLETPVDHVQATLQHNMFSAEAQAELEGGGDEEDFSFAEASVTSSITRGTMDRTENTPPPVNIESPSVEKGKDSDEPSVHESFFADPRRRRLALLGLLLLGVAGALIATGVVISQKNHSAAIEERLKTSSPTTSMAPSASPIASPSLEPSTLPSSAPSSERESQMNAVFRNFYTDTSPAFVFDTIQFEARMWIIYTDPKQLPVTDVAGIKQRYALYVFYLSTGGANWKNKGDWTTGTDECGEVINGVVYSEWFGLGCNDDNEVRALAFDNNNLVGEIPPEITFLYKLENLILKNDKGLAGRIPSSIVGNTELRQLGFYNNGLTGGIPEGIYDLVHLVYLNLSDNQLTGYLNQKIGQLVKLRKLILDNNKLEGGIHPLQLRKLDLIFLGLSKNKFSGNVTEPLRFLSTLEYCYLNDNEFVGSLPAEIGLMTQLKSLTLDGNQFTTTIPKEFGKLTQLSFFTASNAGIYGELPVEIGAMTELRTLNLAGNKISKIPPSVANLNNLKYFYCYQNEVAGEIPLEIFGMEKLEVLFLSSNKLIGEIPENLPDETYTSIKQLYLSDNQLNGTFPTSICKMEKLEVLFLDTNRLSGPLPSCIGNLANLQQFYAFGNQFDGEIPPSISNMTMLESLGLEANNFEGEVHSSICDLRDTNDGKLKEFWTDCKSPGKVVCADDCCTQCCPDDAC